MQHKIEEYNALVWEVISNKKGIICIAGNAKNMPNNVKESIVENVLMKKGKMSQENAKAFIENMESNGRLQMETW